MLGTVKEMTATSGFDKRMPASFAFEVAENYVEDNIAAGSERYGFAVSGLPCSVTAAFKGSFTNNVAHSNLAGLWLRASTASAADGCTLLANFTTYMNWDFGIIRWAMSRWCLRGQLVPGRGQPGLARLLRSVRAWAGAKPLDVESARVQ